MTICRSAPAASRSRRPPSEELLRRGPHGGAEGRSCRTALALGRATIQALDLRPRARRGLALQRPVRPDAPRRRQVTCPDADAERHEPLRQIEPASAAHEIGGDQDGDEAENAGGNAVEQLDRHNAVRVCREREKQATHRQHTKSDEEDCGRSLRRSPCRRSRPRRDVLSQEPDPPSAAWRRCQSGRERPTRGKSRGRAV